MMSNNNVLNLAILNMVHNCINEGKIQLLLDMGFKNEQLNQIKNLSYKEISHIANSNVLFMDININSEMFESILKRAAEDEAQSKMIEKAISLGASIEILNSYFGLSTTNISMARKLNALTVSKGRVRKPNQDEKIIIWEKWTSLVNDNPDIKNRNDQHRIQAYMDITQHVSMLSNESEPLTLTSVIHELDDLVSK